MKTKFKPKPCPKCHKTDMVIPIVYGLPSEGLFKKSEKGQVKLGGCCVELDNPEWYCKRDKVAFT